MGRGILTSRELDALARSPYVQNVTPNRITYTEDFKLLFLKEYYSGKKPMRIFQDAGFDVTVLGSKRIERCCARWKEANAAGSLGEKYEGNDYYERRASNENEKMMLERTIREQQAEISRLKSRIAELEQTAV